MTMTLHWIDYVIIGVIVLSALTGFIRGFIKEIIALGVWVAAVWIAFMYAKPVSAWLGTYIQDRSAQVILAYIVIIVGTVIVGGLLNSMLSFILHHSGLSGTDRLLGIAFGAVRGVFVIALVMVVIRLSAFPEAEYRKKAYLYSYFTPMVNWMYQYAPDLLKRAEDIEHHAKPISNKQRADIMIKAIESL